MKFIKPALTCLAAIGVLTLTCTGGAVQAITPNEPSQSLAWKNSDLTVNQWGLADVGAATALGDGTGVKVAILDTGADTTHSDFSGAFVDGYTVSLNDGAIRILPTPVEKTVDKMGHGTHVAGIIGARKNQKGTTGVAPGVKMLAVNLDEMFSNQELTWAQAADGLIVALNAAAKSGAKVANMSLGSNEMEMPSSGIPSQNAAQNARICTTIATLRTKGMLTVVAAGNSGANGNMASNPGDCPAAIEVGSVDSDNHNSYFSTYNDTVDVVAPGGNILSTLPNSNYGIYSGTSMATPHVTAAVAAIFSTHPSWTAEQVVSELYSTARDLGKQGIDPLYGHGLLDVSAATGGPVTPVKTHDEFSLNARRATSADQEGVVTWNSPNSTNTTGYTVNVYNTVGKLVETYTLGPDVVALPQSVPLTGRYWVNVVAHRAVGGDIDGGWIFFPYMGNILPQSKATKLTKTVLRSTPTTVTYQLTWVKGADTDLTDEVEVGFVSTLGYGPYTKLPPNTQKATITVPKATLNEDGEFYVYYPFDAVDTSNGVSGAMSTLVHKGSAGAFFNGAAPTQVKNVYTVYGGINSSYTKTLEVHDGQQIKVQFRDRRTGHGWALVDTRVVAEHRQDVAGKDQVYYTFKTWVKGKPGWTKTSDMRILLTLRGKLVVTAWAQTSDERNG